MCVCAQQCLTLCDPMDCSSPGLLRQEHWAGLPFPSPGDLPNPEIESAPPVWADGFSTPEPPGKPIPFLLMFLLRVVLMHCCVKLHFPDYSLQHLFLFDSRNINWMQPVYQVLREALRKRRQKNTVPSLGRGTGAGLNINNYTGVPRPSVTACLEGEHGAGRGSGGEPRDWGSRKGLCEALAWEPWTLDKRRLRTCLPVSAHLDLLFCPLSFLKILPVLLTCSLFLVNVEVLFDITGTQTIFPSLLLICRLLGIFGIQSFKKACLIGF